MNILVAVDFTENGRRVVRQAIGFAKQNQATMIVLHVCSLFDSQSDKDDVARVIGIESSELSQQDFEQCSDYAKHSEAQLQTYVTMAQEAEVDVLGEHVIGQPGPIICARAETERADLIIIGRRSQAITADNALGSVSTYVLNRAPCSVWVVQDKKK